MLTKKLGTFIDCGDPFLSRVTRDLIADSTEKRRNLYLTVRFIAYVDASADSSYADRHVKVEIQTKLASFSSHSANERVVRVRLTNLKDVQSEPLALLEHSRRL